jgi:hypothetical protein
VRQSDIIGKAAGDPKKDEDLMEVKPGREGREHEGQEAAYRG